MITPRIFKLEALMFLGLAACAPGMAQDVGEDGQEEDALTSVKGLLFSESWEAGTINANRWTVPLAQLLDGHETRTISTAESRHGDRSLKLSMVPQLNVDSHAELALKLDVGSGQPVLLDDELWIGFSSFLPNPYPIEDDAFPRNEIMLQIHSTSIPTGDTEFNPPVSIYQDLGAWHVHAAKRELPTGDSTGRARTLGAITPGVWQDFIMHVKWNYKDGYIKVWSKKANESWPAKFEDATSVEWEKTSATKGFFSKTDGVGYNRAAPGNTRGTIKVGLYIPSWHAHDSGLKSRTIYMDQFRTGDRTSNAHSVDPARP